MADRYRILRGDVVPEEDPPEKKEVSEEYWEKEKPIKSLGIDSSTPRIQVTSDPDTGIYLEGSGGINFGIDTGAPNTAVTITSTSTDGGSDSTATARFYNNNTWANSASLWVENESGSRINVAEDFVTREELDRRFESNLAQAMGNIARTQEMLTNIGRTSKFIGAVILSAIGVGIAVYLLLGI